MRREGGWDHRHPRPWLAEPMDAARPSGSWRVTCPSKSGSGRDLVQSHLSEGDAKAIARGGNTWQTLADLEPAAENGATL